MKIIKKKIFFILIILIFSFFLFIYCAQPTFAQVTIYQNYFRWYVNEDSVNVLDPWPEGLVDLGELDVITLADLPPSQGSVLRIRMSLNVSSDSLDPINVGDEFKLQYGVKGGGSCSAIFHWLDLNGPGCGEAWCGYDNLTPNDGDLLGGVVLSVSATAETYEEQNFATAVSQIDQGEDGEWDWVIYNNAASASTSYCFRMVNNDNSEFSDYNYYPELITALPTISGVVYIDEEMTPIDPGKTVVLKVNGLDACDGGVCTDETDDNGAYTISDVTISNADDVITVFLSGETEKAAIITKINEPRNFIDLNIYQNRIIVRREPGASAITNNDLGKYDGVDEPDNLYFIVDENNLEVDQNHRLIVWHGTTFEPGGSVTLMEGGVDPGGDLLLFGEFISGGDVLISGSLLGGGTFIGSAYTTTFSSTSSGETITVNGLFYNLTFDGLGGEWTFSSPLTVTNDLNITAGTLIAQRDLHLTGNLTIGANGVFTKNTDYSFLFSIAGTASTWTDNSVLKQDLGDVVVSSGSKTVNLGSSVKATTLTNFGTLNLGSAGYDLDLTGSGTNVLDDYGIIDEGTNSIITYSGDVETTVVAPTAWLDSSWGYRKALRILGGPIEQVDYPLQIVTYYGSGDDQERYVYLNEHGQTDFDDVRFVDSSGTTLSYWRQEHTNSGNAIFWVKIPTIAVTPSYTKIYVYYGNSEAAYEGNGSHTFTFFDDFSGNLGDHWVDKSYGSGTSLIQEYEGDFRLKLHTDTDFSWGAVASNVTLDNNQDYVYEVKMKSSQNTWHSGLTDFADANTATSETTDETVFWDNWVGFGGIKDSTEGMVSSYSALNDSTTRQPIPQATNDDWHLYGVEWRQEGDFGRARFYLDLGQRGEHHENVPILSVPMYLVMYMLGEPSLGAVDYYFDDVRVRKYSQSVNYDLWGAETTDLNLWDGYYNLSFTGSGPYNLGGNIIVANDITIDSGALDVTESNYSIIVQGSWINSAVFTCQQGLVTFQSTSSEIITSNGSPFYNLIIIGDGGTFSLQDPLDIDGELNITIGILDSNNQDVNLFGNLTIEVDGRFTKGSGDFIFDGSGGSFWSDHTEAKQDLGNVIVDGTIAAPPAVQIGSSVKATKITIAGGVNASSLDLGVGEYTLTLTGSGTGASKPLTIELGGTLATGNSTIEYTGSNETSVTVLFLITGGNYYNLTLNGIGPFTAEAGTWTIDNDLSVLNGTFNLGGETSVANDVIIGTDPQPMPGAVLDVTASDYQLNVSGSWINGGIFTAQNGTVVFDSGDSETITNGKSAFYQLTFDNATGSWEMQDSLDVNNNFNLINGTLVQAADHDINFGGSVVLSDGVTFTKASGSGLVVFDGTNAIFTDHTDPKQNLGNVHIGTSPDDLMLCADAIMDSLTINSGDTLYTNGYNLDITNFVTINSGGTLDALSSGSAICFVGGGSNQISLGTDWTVASDGVFLAGISTVIFNGENPFSSLDSGGNDDNHDFNNLIIAKVPSVGSGTVMLDSNDLNVGGDLTIQVNNEFDVSVNNYNVYVGGSWSNSGIFTAQNGTVTFDSEDTGETINSGGTGANKDFYNIVFDNAAGGWIIQDNDLTATNNFSLTNADSFDVTNRTIVVNGEFTNLVGGGATTWTGSTLYLNGTSHTINLKTTEPEIYNILKIGADTDIRMWNSMALTYLVDPSGSLYSMEPYNPGHGTINPGTLYIFGDYHTVFGQTDHWSYFVDFDGQPVGAEIRFVRIYLRMDDNPSGATLPSVTIDDGGTLNVVGGGSVKDDIAVVGIGTGLWDFACYGTCNVQESTWNYLNLTGGTLTVYNTTLNDESVSDGTLNVDWYLGNYLVDKTTLDPIHTDPSDITISENSDTPASTVWKYPTFVIGWGEGATSQTTGTGADGKIPQPANFGAIKIREYAQTNTGYTFYQYNIQIDSSVYGVYDYYQSYGNKYITSTLNIGSGEDECISELWRRNDIDVQNDPEQAIDEPPTNGTWYNGMISGLTFTIDNSNVSFSSLIPGGAPVDQTNTITISTSATNGYVVYAWATQPMTSGLNTIDNWIGTNQNPTEWNPGEFGFGYSTDDYDLIGGTSNRFQGPKFAGFLHSGLGKPVADRTGPVNQEPNTITYRIAANATQPVGNYTTTIIYIVVPNY